MEKKFIDGVYTVHYKKFGRMGFETEETLVVLANTEKKAIARYLAWAKKQNKLLDRNHKVTNNLNNISVKRIAYDLE